MRMSTQLSRFPSRLRRTNSGVNSRRSVVIAISVLLPESADQTLAEDI